MKIIDPSKLQGALNEHDAELVLLRTLVCELIDAHPNRNQLIAKFQREIEGYCKIAPPGTDPEYLVEVKARLEVYKSLFGPLAATE